MSKSNYYALSEIYSLGVLKENFDMQPSQQQASPSMQPAQAQTVQSAPAPGQIIDSDEDDELGGGAGAIINVLIQNGGYRVTKRLPDGSCILTKPGSTVTVMTDGSIEAVNH